MLAAASSGQIEQRLDTLQAELFLPTSEEQHVSVVCTAAHPVDVSTKTLQSLSNSDRGLDGIAS